MHSCVSVLKGRDSEPRILYLLSCISFRIEGEMKKLPDKQKLGAFMAAAALQELLGRIL